MFYRLKKLINNKRGSTAVEFAIIAPVLFSLIIVTIDLNLVMFAQGIMENAAFKSARTGKTGYIEAGKTQEETIMELLNDKIAIGGLFDSNLLTVTTKSYAEFSNVGEHEPYIDANGNGIHDVGENYTDVNGNGQYDEDMGAAGFGNTSEVVVYTITYPWQLFTPFAGTVLGNEGVVNISSRIVLQNEPF